MPEPKDSAPADGRTNIAKWGSDHFSTLLYIETRCVDHRADLGDRGGRMSRMRSDGFAYPTKMRDGAIRGHNDWNCLDDMERVGLLVNRGTGAQPRPELTDAGWALVGMLRRRRADGNGGLPTPAEIARTLEPFGYVAFAEPLAIVAPGQAVPQ